MLVTLSGGLRSEAGHHPGEKPVPAACGRGSSETANGCLRAPVEFRRRCKAPVPWKPTSSWKRSGSRSL